MINTPKDIVYLAMLVGIFGVILYVGYSYGESMDLYRELLHNSSENYCGELGKNYTVAMTGWSTPACCTLRDMGAVRIYENCTEIPLMRVK